MRFFLALIFLSSSVCAAPKCYQVKLYGSLVEKNKGLYFVTHRQSQEEKNWWVDVPTVAKKLELLAYADKFTEVEGIARDSKITIKKIQYSAEAASKSRKAQALQRGAEVPCPL